MLDWESFMWLFTLNEETMSIKPTREKYKMVIKIMPNERWVVHTVAGTTCALKNPSFLPASVHLLPSSPLHHPRLTIQQKHTNESLRKHVVQRISHVQQCSVQAQIMFVITAHQHPATREYLLRQMRLPIPNTHTRRRAHKPEHTRPNAASYHQDMCNM